MKILSAAQIREADAHTIKNEPIASIDLMERAATKCFDWLQAQFPKQEEYLIFCGPGNNGGDGLVIARLLAAQGKQVQVYVINLSGKFSEDFVANRERLAGTSVEYRELSEPTTLVINKAALLIDAIFGSGLDRPIKGFVGGVIEQLNKATNTKVAIDIPSGLYCDDNLENPLDQVVQADHTLTFQIPKLSFLFAEHAPYVGQFHILDIGLDEEFIQSADSKNFFVTKAMAAGNMKMRGKFSHKGTHGHALLIAGSHGKMGAAELSSEACLRSGAGLLTTHVPKCGYEIMQARLPEVMCSVASEENFINELPRLENFNAIGVGPGLGTEQQTQNTIKLLIQSIHMPLVMDADALNILGANKTWLSFLPPGTILTPHPKEFARMAGDTQTEWERVQLAKEFSLKFSVYIVLKGAHTKVVCPDGEVYFNSTGNPGMATAGSGDVLTGIITALLAQGYGPKLASVMGVYLHGFAADIMVEERSMESLIAGDIIEGLGLALKEVVGS